MGRKPAEKAGVRPTDPKARAVLIIDDEPQIRRAVRNALASIAERVLEAATGAAGLDLAAAEQPELIILDLGLPDCAGLDVCRELRSWTLTPIIVLSARHSEQEKVRLLDAGADDYVTKPFSIFELQARVRAQLRHAAERAGAPALAEVRAGGVDLDFIKRVASRYGVKVHLTPTEWKIARTLASAAGRTLTHHQLFDAVWGREFGDPQMHLRVHITRLRRKLEADPSTPKLIITEPGVGYRLEAEG